MLAGFLIWAVISIRWSDTPQSWTDALKRCLYIGIYVYMLVRLCETPDKLKKILLVCCGLAVLAALASLIYHYGILHEPMGYRQYRIGSFIPGSFADLGICIMAGLYYATFAVLLFGWLSSGKNISTNRKVICLLSLLILMAYILMTWSRGPWIALACGLAFVAVMSKNKLSYALLAAGVVGCIAVVVICHHTFDHQVVSSSFGDRTAIWATALHKISLRPWFGYGYDASFSAQTNLGNYVEHSHSYYLQVIRMFGIVGGVFYFSMLAGLAQLIFKYRHHMLVQMAGAALVVGLVGTLTDVQYLITRPSTSWFYIWFPLGIILGVHYQQSRLANKKESLGVS